MLGCVGLSYVGLLGRRSVAGPVRGLLDDLEEFGGGTQEPLKGEPLAQPPHTRVALFGKQGFLVGDIQCRRG